MTGGEGGIRTPGTDERYNGFRGRRIRPLCHLTRNQKLKSQKTEQTSLLLPDQKQAPRNALGWTPQLHVVRAAGKARRRLPEQLTLSRSRRDRQGRHLAAQQIEHTQLRDAKSADFVMNADAAVKRIGPGGKLQL